MSKPMADTPKRRPRRQFTDEFKASAVRLVLDDGKSVGSVACDLDLTETALRDWVKRARADRTHGKTGLTTAEREELARLRKENRELRTEREILKKAAAFFAKHQQCSLLGLLRRRPPSELERCAGRSTWRRAATTRGAVGRNRRVWLAIGTSRGWSARRSRRAGSGTAARASTRICWSRMSASVGNG